MCGAFRVKNLDEFPNLTVKKIPKVVLNRCEWGKDDYSLEIKNLPVREEPLIGQVESDAERGRKGRTKAERRALAAGQPSLFDLPPQEKKPRNEKQAYRDRRCRCMNASGRYWTPPEAPRPAL